MFNLLLFMFDQPKGFNACLISKIIIINGNKKKNHHIILATYFKCINICITSIVKSVIQKPIQFVSNAYIYPCDVSHMNPYLAPTIFTKFIVLSPKIQIGLTTLFMRKFNCYLTMQKLVNMCNIHSLCNIKFIIESCMARMQVCHPQLPYFTPQNFVHWDPFLFQDGCQQLNQLNIHAMSTYDDVMGSQRQTLKGLGCPIILIQFRFEFVYKFRFTTIVHGLPLESHFQNGLSKKKHYIKHVSQIKLHHRALIIWAPHYYTLPMTMN